MRHPDWGKARFDNALLFTHRGISGPAILQVSSYWLPGAELHIDLSPDTPKVKSLVEDGLLAEDRLRLRATRSGRLLLDRLTGPLAT